MLPTGCVVKLILGCGHTWAHARWFGMNKLNYLNVVDRLRLFRRTHWN